MKKSLGVMQFAPASTSASAARVALRTDGSLRSLSANREAECHPPTPWTFRSNPEPASGANFWIDGAPQHHVATVGEPIANVYSKDVAEFIVRACNSHASLLEALTELAAFHSIISPETPGTEAKGPLADKVRAALAVALGEAA